ncbi:MAG TPA: hypothetical protein DCS19_07965 [Flavobacterium sp.]|nr:hypothetical protein [Flavobacterium sp.]
METNKKERKKRTPNPNLPKNCGFRVGIGEFFWSIVKKNDYLEPFERFETEKSIKQKNSVNSILAENGNYYRTKEDCLYRINFLKIK